MEELNEAVKGSDGSDLISLKNSYFLEIDLYDKKFEDWETRAKVIIKRYRDERGGLDQNSRQNEARYNILWSNIQTMIPNVFARLPQPEVSRRYKDKDPVGRVASMILERALEYEVEAYSDYENAVRNSVEDRLLAGRGISWVRYMPVMKDVEMPEQPMDGEEGTQISEDTPKTYPVIDYECSPCDYVAWRDFGHNVARTWEEVNTVWRIVPMTREELVERFGEEIGEQIPLDMKTSSQDVDTASPEELAKMKANIYELWDKKEKRCVWLSKSHQKALDVQEDILGLDGFFPCPKPLYATTTTDSLIPVPDYALYQDLAKELDTLTDRINGLADSIKVIGVYDSTQTGVKRMLKEGVNTELIPVDNWMMFAEKGGIKGVIDWLPLSEVVGALNAAYMARDQAKQAVFEIMGISDILRGSSNPNETLGAQQMKGQFASKRLKYMQNAVSTFATHLLKIKAQIICNHYQPETILMISGAEQFSDEDKQLIQPALELLKNNVLNNFRIEVSSNSLIEIDEQQEKQDRMEFLTAVGTYMEKAILLPPQLHAVAGELLLYGVRGFRTGRQLEGQIDDALESLKDTSQQPPKPDPEMIKMQAEQQRQAGEDQRAQQKQVADVQLGQQKLAADQQNAQMKASNEMQLAQLKAQNQQALEQEKIASAERIAMHKDDLAADSAMKSMEADQIKDMQTQEVDHEQDHALQELSVSVCQLHKKLEEMSIKMDTDAIGKLL
jgi:hypothetical protein